MDDKDSKNDAYERRKKRYISFFKEDKEDISKIREEIYRKLSECKNIQKLKSIECILNEEKVYFKETEKQKMEEKTKTDGTPNLQHKRKTTSLGCDKNDAYERRRKNYISFFKEDKIDINVIDTSSLIEYAFLFDKIVNLSTFSGKSY